MKDFLGQDIEVDDPIVYAGRVSSSLYLTKGRVSQVNELKGTIKVVPTRQNRLDSGVHEGAEVTLSRLDTVVVVR